MSNARNFTQELGGLESYTKYSGTAGGDAAITSGRGRVHSVVLHSTMLTQSGKRIALYDADVAVSGGPLSTSGHKIVGALNAPHGHSGQVTEAGTVHLNALFTSGLCISAQSGDVGATVFFSKEPHFS